MISRRGMQGACIVPLIMKHRACAASSVIISFNFRGTNYSQKCPSWRALFTKTLLWNSTCVDHSMCISEADHFGTIYTDIHWKRLVSLNGAAPLSEFDRWTNPLPPNALLAFMLQFQLLKPVTLRSVRRIRIPNQTMKLTSRSSCGSICR
jgi:hypothetical protein